MRGCASKMDILRVSLNKEMEDVAAMEVHSSDFFSREPNVRSSRWSAPSCCPFLTFYESSSVNVFISFTWKPRFPPRCSHPKIGHSEGAGARLLLPTLDSSS